MAIDKATVLRIAKLARIDISDDNIGDLAEELNVIMAWVEQLSEVDTEGVVPMTSVVQVTLPQRPDKSGGTPTRDDLLANAPHSENGYFTVPKVIE